MKRNVAWLIFFSLICVGSWFNVVRSLVTLSQIAQPVAWDEIKVAIDLIVAGAWSLVVALWFKKI